METTVNYTVTMQDAEDYKKDRDKMGDAKSVCDYCAFQRAIQRALPGHRVEMSYSPIIDGQWYPGEPTVTRLVKKIDRFTEDQIQPDEIPLEDQLPYHGTLTLLT